MLIVRWCEIEETEWIPPFGGELEAHLREKKGSVFHASCSAWNLLHRTLIENGLEVGKVGFTEGGKPYFKGNNLYFSISHSHSLCAVAISNVAVGVDIEVVKDHYNPRLVERSLSANEKRYYTGDFTLLWSRKEAVAKMTGNGIIGYPIDIDTVNYCFFEEKISLNDEEYYLVILKK